MITRNKLIKSGNIVLFLEFEKRIKYGDSKTTSVGRIKKEVDLKDPFVLKAKIENKKRSLERSRSTLKSLVNANAGYWKDKNGRPFMPIFLNLTFGENIKNIKEANLVFTKFKQKFDYEITRKKKSYLKYAVVIEFQERGAVHYHALFFNMPFIERIYDKINRMWAKGHMIVESVRDIDDIASYICKYITKDGVDKRLLGQKAYFTSRGLKKPIESLDEEKNKNIINSIPNFIKPYENEFENEFCGKIKCKRYDLTNYKDEKEKLDILLEYNL